MAGNDPRDGYEAHDWVAQLVEEPTRVEPSADLRGRLLASVSRDRRFEGFVARAAELFDLSLDASRALLARVADVAGSAWVDGPPGVRLFHFESGPALPGAHSGLVHLAPGARFPEHRHVGAERAFVIQGILVEENGETWAPGDVALRAAESRHALRCGGSEPVVFVAAVLGGIDVEPVG
jgi:putative transcriptional regulator